MPTPPLIFDPTLCTSATAPCYHKSTYSSTMFQHTRSRDTLSRVASTASRKHTGAPKMDRSAQRTGSSSSTRKAVDMRSPSPLILLPTDDSDASLWNHPAYAETMDEKNDVRKRGQSRANPAAVKAKQSHEGPSRKRMKIRFTLCKRHSGETPRHAAGDGDGGGNAPHTKSVVTPSPPQMVDRASSRTSDGGTTSSGVDTDREGPPPNEEESGDSSERGDLVRRELGGRSEDDAPTMRIHPGADSTFVVSLDDSHGTAPLRSTGDAHGCNDGDSCPSLVSLFSPMRAISDCPDRVHASTDHHSLHAEFVPGNKNADANNSLDGNLQFWSSYASDYHDHLTIREENQEAKRNDGNSARNKGSDRRELEPSRRGHGRSHGPTTEAAHVRSTTGGSEEEKHASIQSAAQADESSPAKCNHPHACSSMGDTGLRIGDEGGSHHDDSIGCNRPYPHHPKKLDWVRSALIRWLMDVAEEYSLHRQTMHLCAKLVDRVLAVNKQLPLPPMDRSSPRTHRNCSKERTGTKDPVLTKTLHCMGSACMLIAAKLEEIYPPVANDFVALSPGTFSLREILAMEVDICQLLSFDLWCVTPFNYVEQFVQAAACHSSCLRVQHQNRDGNSFPRVHDGGAKQQVSPEAKSDLVGTMASYLSELALLDGCLSTYPSSLVAASVVYLAMLMTGVREADLSKRWKQTVKCYSKCDMSEMENAVIRLNDIHAKAKNSIDFHVVFKRYRKKESHLALETVLQPEDLFCDELDTCESGNT